MNPYTLKTRLRVGDKIAFRPRFSRKVTTGTVVAIKSNDGALFGDGDAVSKVYVKYVWHHDFKDHTQHEWVTHRRIFHIVEDMLQPYPVFTPGPRCTRPPLGWFCTRGLDHEGPCAAWPEGTDAS